MNSRQKLCVHAVAIATAIGLIAVTGPLIEGLESEQKAAALSELTPEEITHLFAINFNEYTSRHVITNTDLVDIKVFVGIRHDGSIDIRTRDSVQNINSPSLQSYQTYGVRFPEIIIPDNLVLDSYHESYVAVAKDGFVVLIQNKSLKGNDIDISRASAIVLNLADGTMLTGFVDKMPHPVTVNQIQIAYTPGQQDPSILLQLLTGNDFINLERVGTTEG